MILSDPDGVSNRTPNLGPFAGLPVNSEFAKGYFFGYDVVDYSVKNGMATVWLRPTEEAVCPRCGKRCSKLKERFERVVRDCPLGGTKTTTLVVPLRRVRCSCGCTATEALPWLSKHARLTDRHISQLQSQLRDNQTVKAVADRYDLDWHTVKEADKAQLAKFYTDVNVRGIRRLALDEFALRKGHRYATVFMDLDQGRIVHIVIGKTNQAVREGFEYLRDHGGLDSVEMVAMDMNAGWPKLVKEFLPKADLVYDLFHVIQNFTADVAREAKLETIRRATKEAQKEQRRLLRGAEFYFVMREEALEPYQRSRLDEILKTNELYMALLPIADYLRSIWKAPNQFQAAQYLHLADLALRDCARELKFPPAAKFADMLQRRSEGILKAWKYGGQGTSKLEGANNKIKVIKRVGYGYRDMEYFFLKIKATICGSDQRMIRMLGSGDAVHKDGTVSDSRLRMTWSGREPIRGRNPVRRRSSKTTTSTLPESAARL